MSSEGRGFVLYLPEGEDPDYWEDRLDGLEHEIKPFSEYDEPTVLERPVLDEIGGHGITHRGRDDVEDAVDIFLRQVDTEEEDRDASGSEYQEMDKPWIPPEITEEYRQRREEENNVDFSSPRGVWTANYEGQSLRLIGMRDKIHDEALYAARDLGMLPEGFEFGFTYPESRVQEWLADEGFIDEGEEQVFPINVPNPLIREVEALTDFWFDYQLRPNKGILSFYDIDIPIRDREGETSAEIELLAHLSDADIDTGVEWDEERGQFMGRHMFVTGKLQNAGLISGTKSRGYSLRADLPPGIEEELERILEERQQAEAAKAAGY